MSVAASRYAKALLDVLYPANAGKGLEQLRSFSAVLLQEVDARLVFENPTISTEKRKDLLKNLAGPLQLEAQTQNFLGLLIERNRLELLTEIISTYESLLDDRLGVIRARVTSALDLDAGQQDQIVARLQTLTGKKVRVQMQVDSSLIGGLVAQVGSTIYDGSIRRQLQSFKNSLTQD